MVLEVVHYKLNDNAPSVTVVDAAGNYDGVATHNTDTWTDTGKINSALHSVSGIAQYFTAGNITQINYVQKVSVALWMKLDSLADYAMMYGKDPTDAQRFILGCAGAAYGGPTKLMKFIGTGGNTFAYTQDDVLSTGVWIHVFIIFDGTQTGNSNRLKIYVNNVQKALNFYGTIPAYTTANTTALRVYRSTRYNATIGQLDDFRIYDFILSDEDRALIYKNGSGTETDLETLRAGGGSLGPYEYQPYAKPFELGAWR